MNAERVRPRTRGAGRRIPLLSLVLPVAVGGGGALAGAIVELARTHPGAGLLGAVALLAIASTLAEAFPVPLESVPNGSVSLAAVFVVGAALLYGWHAATIVAFTTRGAIELIARRPFVRFAYNSSVYALGGVAAGLAAGASPAHGQVLGPLAAVALAAAAFYAVNVVLIAAVIAVSSRQAFFTLLAHSAYWTAIPFAIMASVSLMLNVLWEQSPVFAAALAGPLIAILLYQRSVHRGLAAMRLALTDPLTGLGNHRHFQEQLESGLERAGADGAQLTLCMIDIDDFKRVNDGYGHPAGDRLLALIGSQLRQDGEAFRLGGDEFALVLTCGAGEGRFIAERVVERIAAVEHEAVGTISVSAGVATFPEHADERSELVRCADEALYRAKWRGKNRVATFDASAPQGDRLPLPDTDRAARLRAASALVRASEVRDAQTGAHADSVANLAERIARRLGLDGEQVALIRLAALLHDIGKLATPADVLSKVSALTASERDVVERHPQTAFEMLEGLGVEPVATWVRHHHERWDGAGYPSGLTGAAIPLGARILFVADAYDAITTDRVYRRARSHAEAVAELERCSGSQFDPVVVTALVDELGTMRPALTVVASQTG